MNRSHRNRSHRRSFRTLSAAKIGRDSNWFEALESRLLLAVPGTWSPTGVGATGALYNATISPLNSSEMTIAADMGQIFHTSATDGTGWDIYDATKVSSNYLATMEYTSQQGLMYYRGNSTAGPMVTTDSGSNWAPLKGWNTSWGACMQVFVDPASASAGSARILASVSPIIDQSGNATPGTYGLYYSSNGGSTFTQVTQLSGSNGVLWQAGAFFDGQNIYVGTNLGLGVSRDGGSTWTLNPAALTGIDFSSVTGPGMWSLSGSKLGGVTRLWTTIFPRAYSEGAGYYYAIAPNRLILDKIDTNGDTTPDTAFWKLTGSEVGVQSCSWDGSNWTAWTQTTLPTNYIGTVVAAVPTDNQKVYIGGGETTVGDPAIAYSSNAGSSWSKEFRTKAAGDGVTPNANIHAAGMGDGGDRGWNWGGPAFSIAVAPGNGDRVVFTDVGGAWGTTNATQGSSSTWYAQYVAASDTGTPGQNLTPGTPHHGTLNETTMFDLNWTDSETIVAGCADVDSLTSNDGGTSWHYNTIPPVGNTMYNTVTDPATGIMYASTSKLHDLYLLKTSDGWMKTSNNDDVLMSTDKGTTWTIMHQFRNHDGIGDYGTPVRKVALDPRHPNRLYAMLVDSQDGKGGIWVTDNLNAGTNSTWTQLPSPANCSLHPLDMHVLNDGRLVAVYSVNSTNDGLAGVWVSSDGGTTWAAKTPPDTSMYGKTLTCKFDMTSVFIDPADASQNTWYATSLNNPGHYGGIWRTTDGGSNWTSVGADPTNNGGYYSVMRRPGTTEMYATSTVGGLLYTADCTVQSPTWSRVANFKFQLPLQVCFNPYNPAEIFVSTYGNGVYRGNCNDLTAPAPVAGLTADARSQDKVVLRWTNSDVPLGAGLHIYYGIDGVNYSLLDTVDGNVATSYVATGLTANTTYYFKVCSFNAAGEAVPCNVATAKTLETPSLLVSENFNYTGVPGATWNGGTGLSGNWTKTSGTATAVTGSLTSPAPADTLTVSGNRAELSGGPGVITRSLASVVGADNQTRWLAYEMNTAAVSNPYMELDNASGEKVFIGVRSTNKLSVEVYDAAHTGYYWSGTTCPFGTTGLLVVRIDYATTAGGDRIRLYWDPSTSSSASNPIPYLDPANLGANNPWDEEPACIGEWVCAPTYYFPRSMNAIKFSSGTPAFDVDELRIGKTYGDVTTGTAPAAPATVSGLTATASAQRGTINLNWSITGITNERGYKIYQSPTSNGTYTLIDTIYTPQLSSYVVSNGLSDATAYYFKVAAFNDNATINQSAYASATTVGAIPAAPTGLSLASSAGSDGNSVQTIVTITAGNSTDHTSVSLDYCDGSQDVYGQPVWTNVVLNGSLTSYQTTLTLKANRSYSFRVGAVNSAGTSNYIHAITTTLQAPVTPSATASASDQIAVSWTQYSGSYATNLVLQRSTDNATWGNDVTLNPTDTTYNATGLTADTQYYFRLKATNSSCSSSFSDSCVARTLIANSNLTAYEPFNYSAGAQATTGNLNGGSGWAGAWVSTLPSYSAVGASSLTNGNGLLTIGNDCEYQNNNADMTRTLANSLGTSGTFWFSFVWDLHGTNLGGGLRFTDGGSSNWIDFGAPRQSKWSVMSNTGNIYQTAATAPSYDTNYYVVGCVTYVAQTGGDVIKLWVNPTPGSTTPSDASALINYTCPANQFVIRNINTVTLRDASYTNADKFDEVRVGVNYAAVAMLTVAAPPTVLTANPVSTTEVDLAWTDNASNETNYYVERGTDGVNYGQVQTLAANSTSWADTGRTAGTTYYYRVTAHNDTGDSVYSNVSSAHTNGGASSVIAYDGFNYSTGSLNGSNGGNGWSDAWAATGDYQSTNSLIASGSYTAPSPADTLATIGNHVTLTCGNIGTRHTSSNLYVDGTNTTIWASYLCYPDKQGYTASTSMRVGGLMFGMMGSNVWGIVADGTTPTQYYYSTTSVQDHVPVLLVMEVVYGSPNYSVYLWLNPAPGSTAPSVGSAIKSVTNMAAGYFPSRNDVVMREGAYSQVDGLDEVRLGRSYGDVAPVQTSAPTNVATSVQSFSKVKLTWTNNAPSAVGQLISISTDGGTTYKPMVYLTDPAASSYTLTGLAANATYYVKVAAYDGATYNYSSAISFGTSAPAAPTSPSATASSNSQINLAWTDAATNESGYEIWYSTDPNANDNSLWQLLTVTAANVNSFSATGLYRNLQYYFRTRAFNGIGFSSFSSIVGAQTQA